VLSRQCELLITWPSIFVPWGSQHWPSNTHGGGGGGDWVHPVVLRSFSKLAVLLKRVLGEEGNFLTDTFSAHSPVESDTNEECDNSDLTGADTEILKSGNISKVLRMSNLGMS
jgi:hypothetical protein